MFVSVRSYLSSGLAAATATIIIVAPAEAQRPAQPEAPPLTLVAQMQPLQLPAPAVLVNLPAQLPALIAQQVAFNSGVPVDFVVTGAQLIGRQVQVAQTFVNDITNGTPIPVALGRAVVGITDIELDAGRELVGFGEELADFQIQFLGNLVAALPPAIATPAGHALARSAGAVDAVGNAANGILDNLESALPATAQTQTKTHNVVTLRTDNPKTTRRVSHPLRVSSAATDNSNAGSHHRQLNRLHRQHDNSGEGNAKHRKADN